MAVKGEKAQNGEVGEGTSEIALPATVEVRSWYARRVERGWWNEGGVPVVRIRMVVRRLWKQQSANLQAHNKMEQLTT